MLESEPSAMAKTTTAKHTRTIRIVRRSAHSSICGSMPLITFSLRITEGASKVALEQLITAESTAPKNITWAKGGVYSTIKVGKTSWESRSSSPPNFTGSTSNAEYAMNIGTKQKQKYRAAPMSEP